MAVVDCSATGLNAAMLVASADSSETADWRRIVGLAPAPLLLPVDAERTADAVNVPAAGCCCGAVVWETRLDERRVRACPQTDMGDACEDDMEQ